MDAPALRFICDDHCGRLARWLRTLGFDCAHDQGGTDAAVLALALSEERIILTRDHRLAGQALARRVILLSSPDPLDQVRQALEVAGAAIDPGSLFTRCAVCNRPTAAATLETVAERIPPYVRRTQTAFRVCSGCGRIYWRGTHVQRMLARLEAAGLLPHVPDVSTT
jgi:uncharacterized protein with PIN domain